MPRFSFAALAVVTALIASPTSTTLAQADVSYQTRSLSGQWTYRAKAFGGECAASDDIKESIVTINQNGNQFRSSGGFSFQARGAMESDAIGNGSISGKQIQSRSDVISWAGIVSEDGNSIQGTATCVMGGGGTGRDSFEFTMVRQTVLSTPTQANPRSVPSTSQPSGSPGLW